MAGFSPFAYFSEPEGDANFNAGLNTAGGNLSLQDNESPDLQNVDYIFFGSVIKRNGYIPIVTGPLLANFNNTSVTFNSLTTTFNGAMAAGSTGSVTDGLWWYEAQPTGGIFYYLITVWNGQIYYMSGFNGVWNNITGSNTITAGNFCQFENFINNLYVTNGQDTPFYWTGTGTTAVIPGLSTGAYVFQVTGVSTVPTVGSVYTVGGVNYTITAVAMSATNSGVGNITATGASAPTSASGTISIVSGTGDANITYIYFIASIGLSNAKYIEQFNNFMFLANVTVNGSYYPTRLYWSQPLDPTTWFGTSWIECSFGDGQPITGIRVLGNQLIVFKTRSIYALTFTGDPTFPFVFAGGGKTNSAVGCVAPSSIQECQNGLVFLSFDGLYYFDGQSSTKMSDKINPTMLGLNTDQWQNARSMLQHKKHRYLIALPSASSNTNDTIITWDYYLNAFSIYQGMNPGAMSASFAQGFQEAIYFQDFSGWTYQADTGLDDYPLNVQTAINSFYYTNWKSYGDIVDQMAIEHLVLYYQYNNAILTVVYSYDGQTTDTYSLVFSTATASSMFGSAIFDTSAFAGTGGGQQRLDPDGRGRIVRYGFKNANLTETFRIDGLGSLPHLETPT